MLLATASIAQLHGMEECDIQSSMQNNQKENQINMVGAPGKGRNLGGNAPIGAIVSGAAGDAYRAVGTGFSSAGTAMSDAAGYVGNKLSSGASAVKQGTIDFSNQFQDSLAEQQGQGGNGYTAPTTYSGRAYQMAKNVYNTPGALVDAIGGQGDFISGDTGSLRSAAISVGSGIASGARTAGRVINDASVNTFNATKTTLGNVGRATGMLAQAPIVETSFDENNNTIKTTTNSDGSKEIATFDTEGNQIGDTQKIAAPNTWVSLPSRTISALYAKLPSLKTPSLKLSFGKSAVTETLTENNVDPTNPPTNTQKSSLTSLMSNFVKSITPNMSMPDFSALVSKLNDNVMSLFRSKPADVTSETNTNADDASVGIADVYPNNSKNSSVNYHFSNPLPLD